MKDQLKKLTPFSRKLVGKSNKLLESQKIMSKFLSLDGDIFYDDDMFSFDLVNGDPTNVK